MTQMPNSIRQFIKIAFGFPLTVVSLAFIARIIYVHKAELPSLHTISPLPLFAGIICVCLFYLIRSIVWHRIIKDQVTKKLDPLESIYFLSVSELRRYIPGSVFAFMSRGFYFKKYGLEPKHMPKLLIIEAIVFVISACILSIPALSYFQDSIVNVISFKYSIFFIALFLIGALFGIWKIFHKISNKDVQLKSLQDFAITTGIAMLGWFFFGFGNFLITSSFVTFDFYNSLPFISLFVFSWLIGYLSFITPMGLGIREGVIALLLQKQFTLGIASAIGIWSRLIVIASEILFVLSLLVIRKYKITQYFQKPWQDNIAIFITILYSTYFSLVTLAKHAHFMTGKYDLGNMAHVLYHTTHGNIFQHTDPGGTEIVSRLATHADFILILISPFSILFDESELLLVLQSVALGAGVYITYKLAELILNNKNLALLFGVSYALNFWVQKQNLFDFHPITLATPLVLLTFYYIFKKKIIHSLVFLMLALLTKEQMYAVGFLVGAYITFFKRKKIGIAVMTGSLVTFYLLMNVFIPNSHTGGHFALSYFEELGSTPTEIIINSILKPHILISTFFAPDRITYLKLLLSPLGILPLFAPIFLIGALPDFLINMMSNNPHLRDINYHYGAVIIPFMYISAIAGSAFLIKKRLPFLIIASYLVIMTVYSFYTYGALPGAKNPSIEMFKSQTEGEAALEYFLKSVPSYLSVSASNNLGAHLVQRKDLFVYPVGKDIAQVIIISKTDKNASPNLQSHLKDIRILENDPHYRTIFKNAYAQGFLKTSLIAK